MKTIVQLEPGVWLRDGTGDPCRTVCKENATVYPSDKAATIALLDARKYRPFRRAKLQTAEVGET